MKTINKIIIALAGIAFVACSDFLDTQSPSYDSGGIYESEAGLKEGVVGIYNLLYMEGTFTNSSHRPAVVTIDNFTGKFSITKSCMARPARVGSFFS